LPLFKLQLHSQAFRHMRELIGALYTVAPGVLEDPRFLDRSVLVDGVTSDTSPHDLAECFVSLDVESSVLVRDTQTGFRIGLVVFSNDADSVTAARLAPHPGFYATCVPVSSHPLSPCYCHHLDVRNFRVA
jgi:hypothetical protein